LNAEEYERRARQLVPAAVWDYIAGGSGAERTLAANELAFDRYQLRPRVLVDISHRSIATELFGATLAAPIGVAPTAYHRLVHPEGEVATARGAGLAGVFHVVSIFASRSLEEIAAATDAPLWLQLYWLRRREVLARLAGRAADAGYRALVLTVDTPVLGERLRDVRNGFALDPSIRAVNLDVELTETVHRKQEAASALAIHAGETFDTAITWADLAWLRTVSSLPLLVKGILTAEDARLAVEHGVDGIVVSNHGGRQLDGAVTTLDALPEVVAAAGGRCPVLVDGGIRSGTDVFVALALGADAVLVGRPVLWALACGGDAEVANLLGMLTRGLDHTMALAGRPTLASIDSSAVRR
jgi:4-hydroxymandelate oxidase